MLLFHIHRTIVHEHLCNGNCLLVGCHKGLIEFWRGIDQHQNIFTILQRIQLSTVDTQQVQRIMGYTWARLCISTHVLSLHYFATWTIVDILSHDIIHRVTINGSQHKAIVLSAPWWSWLSWIFWSIWVPYDRGNMWWWYTTSLFIYNWRPICTS